MQRGHRIQTSPSVCWFLASGSEASAFTYMPPAASAPPSTESAPPSSFVFICYIYIYIYIAVLIQAFRTFIQPFFKAMAGRACTVEKHEWSAEWEARPAASAPAAPQAPNAAMIHVQKQRSSASAPAASNAARVHVQEQRSAASAPAAPQPDPASNAPAPQRTSLEPFSIAAMLQKILSDGWSDEQPQTLDRSVYQTMHRLYQIHAPSV